MHNEEVKVMLECIRENITALQMLSFHADYEEIDYYKALEPCLVMLENAIEIIR
ncbi:hypothetical protein [Anaerorhabdus sp.]|uniref:hypothetical protein n=1 Tax=Anaerorhabdus sp. TaxID=1872524 RepID=UPI002FC8881A